MTIKVTRAQAINHLYNGGTLFSLTSGEGWQICDPQADQSDPWALPTSCPSKRMVRRFIGKLHDEAMHDFGKPHVFVIHR